MGMITSQHDPRGKKKLSGARHPMVGEQTEFNEKRLSIVRKSFLQPRKNRSS